MRSQEDHARLWDDSKLHLKIPNLAQLREAKMVYRYASAGQLSMHHSHVEFDVHHIVKVCYFTF